MIASLSRARRGGVDRRAHLLEGAAPTDIGDIGLYGGVGRLWFVLEQIHHRHDHAALAVAALRHVVVEPSLLHGGELAADREALDGGDLLAGDRARRYR